MFINDAQHFGLSQLYQLRGRVGRSKNKAYCYLIIPKGKQLEKDALERLKILQENTTLGSGIRIAHYDLELRGAGNILGENSIRTCQLGRLRSVHGTSAAGHCMKLKVKTFQNDIEPEINIPLTCSYTK